MPRHFILIPVGSSGDVHPHVGLGLRLKERGHRVTVAVDGHFEELVRKVGLEYHELTPKGDFEGELLNKDLWNPRTAFQTVARIGMVPVLEKVYNFVVEQHKPGHTVFVAAALAIGARIAQEKHNIPVVTIQLQPGAFRTLHDVPWIKGFPVSPRSPRWMKRLSWWAADVFIINGALGKPVNQLRKKLGMKPVKSVIGEWWNSPLLTLAMFPDWFAARQPDWPASVKIMGFPLYDERGAAPMPKGSDEWLREADGNLPIVFTFGSAMRVGREIFTQSLMACHELRRRGAFLTKYPEQLPKLPASLARHFDYIPLSEALRPGRAAALVHHGGIGTTSQALAAGVPQLIVPFAHDQHDNASRVERLGAGVWLDAASYRSREAAEKLNYLLTSPSTADACRDVAQRFVGDDPLVRACEELEKIS